MRKLLNTFKFPIVEIIDVISNGGLLSMFFFDEKPKKRTLSIRDKQILYRRAKGICENPACKKKIEFDEMQVGHKIAFSKGGNTTLKNSVCLCYRCNKLQGTDSWKIFLKKQGIAEKPIKKTKKTKKTKKIKKKSEDDDWGFSLF